MRISKIILPVLLIGVASIGARQLIQRGCLIKGTQTNRADQRRPVLEVVSSVPRLQTGKYDTRDVALLPNGEIWAVGYDEKSVDHVYVSKDKGETWNRVEVPTNGFLLSAITFTDAQHGWAVGSNGVIIRTKDGGIHWELLPLRGDVDRGERLPDLHAVHFVDANVGYIAGNRRTASKTSDEVSGDVEVLCTKDGGDNWRRCYQEDEPLSVMQITSKAQATFVVLNSHVIRSEDQGESWQEVSTSAKYILGMAFSVDGAGWAVGTHGVFQKSTDGGRTWNTVSLPANLTDREWWGIAFNNDGIGLAVGENATLALTTDNGQTWQLQTTIPGENPRAIRMRDSQAMVLGEHNAYSLAIGSVSGQQPRSN